MNQRSQKKGITLLPVNRNSSQCSQLHQYYDWAEYANGTSHHQILSSLHCQSDLNLKSVLQKQVCPKD